MFQHAKWDALQWPGGEADPDREDGGMVVMAVGTIVDNPEQSDSLTEERHEMAGAIGLRAHARRRDSEEEEEEDEYEEDEFEDEQAGEGDDADEEFDEDLGDDEDLDDDFDDDIEEEEEDV